MQKSNVMESSVCVICFVDDDCDLVIISCSTCCLVGLVKTTWVCGSFHPTRQQVLQLMMNRFDDCNLLKVGEKDLKICCDTANYIVMRNLKK